MRHYEAVVIYPVHLVADKLTEAKKVFEDQVAKQGGKVLGAQDLGRRSFGFQVKKLKEGHYLLFDFDLDPSKVNDLQKSIHLTESILRFSIFLKEAPTKESIYVQRERTSLGAGVKPASPQGKA